MTGEDEMKIRQAMTFLATLAAAGYAASVHAKNCHREGVDVSCDDGRRGVWSGDTIIWPGSMRSRLSARPSVAIGNKSSVTVGPGVFGRQGKGMVPLADPGKARCVALDDVAYCNLRTLAPGPEGRPWPSLSPVKSVVRSGVDRP